LRGDSKILAQRQQPKPTERSVSDLQFANAKNPIVSHVTKTDAAETMMAARNLILHLCWKGIAADNA
jgi:hypothetical protein